MPLQVLYEACCASCDTLALKPLISLSRASTSCFKDATVLRGRNDTQNKNRQVRVGYETHSESDGNPAIQTHRQGISLKLQTKEGSQQPM